ncbi:branched-chain amino acid aminotransferase [Tessaracoccus bendigoensis DSM 12906]|uniref:branched-chain-amino-acid transaminase n=1 Tax=Tessaracoccus bendigoensis DSM 12906 TaxID=1123357 RepID=A0A1M6MEN2_9ACTN|nr:branched-chain amino acid aminotransferase [Tessaracoccus bendigoensis]SHJ81897.1 branched-chain amino acid aminotransferase [Tessaracoccus bendigoensis DSM 12906]
MAQFSITRTTNPTSDAVRNAALADPGFGHYYVDHQVVIDYVGGDGWQDPRIIPMGEWSLHPAAATLHYGQEIFEGLKAYRRDDDSIWLFRPDRNAARFVGSAQRMGMAPLPEDLFLDSVNELVTLEKSWVPVSENEQSLYIRPFMIASEPYLGVREANNYRFAVIATPAGPYYSEPVKLWITPNYTRSAPGGTGTAKCGGNYAASLVATQEAAENGCGQVLWTDGAEHKWVEECGTMNIMFVTADGELVTPSLGTILAGVTRESILSLATMHDLKPVERPISIDEVLDGVDSGQIPEVFACGTAAVVTPIVGFNSPGRGVQQVGDGQPGPKTQEIRKHLVDIQYGRAEDPFGWTKRVC